MDPMTLAALVGAGGSLFQGGMGMMSSAKQMKFQERMSSTAHQREVADMRAAGLNPALSAMGGSGASAPQGAGFEGVNPVASAQDAQRARRELDVMYTQAQKNTADAQKSWAERDESFARKSLTDKETEHVGEELLNNRLHRWQQMLLLPSQTTRSRFDKTWFGGQMSEIERMRQAIFGGGPMVVAPSLPTRRRR